MMVRLASSGVLLILVVLASCGVFAESFDPAALDEAFKGAQQIDLATSQVPSVVKLRDVVKIPPPTQSVLVKTFKRDSIPPVLTQAFVNPNVSGVTIAGRYVAIIQTNLTKEYNDVLSHELVHAYISLACPKPLPFWFQEGAAVHFSTDKTRKFYGQPSKDQTGVMIGKTVELNETYKQKLQSFHFMIEKAGDKKFNKWFREAVMTGTVDPRPLIGLGDSPSAQPSPNKHLPIWLIAAIAGIVIIVIAIGIYAARRDDGYIG
ncbi:hypothetical protein LLG46_06945 [bacterium]|nr:hypothetical protein [bacterium]